MGGDYFRLALGENKVRVLTEPEKIAIHYSPAERRSFLCTGDVCPHCKAKRPSHRIMLYVLDRADGKVKLAELPWSVFTALGELANTSEYAFKDIPPYDIIIMKSGEGLDTTYTVQAGRNESSLTAEQQAELANKKQVKEIIAARRAKELEKAVNDIPHPLAEDDYIG